ncbi:MAG: DUF5686 family protein [Crocinitomicaceae bacterium]|nr:DUF5686 family protein [Crocinitomicaceae bacterium]
MQAHNLLTAIIFLLISTTGTAQHLLRGTITDEQGIPIPMAKIFAKNAADLRTIADDQGRYEMRLYEGEYFLVFKATGYDEKEVYITITGKEVEKNITLYPTKTQDLIDVTVSAKKSNPGREIMLKVVEKRDRINPWNRPHSVQGYIRATEKIDRKEEKPDKPNKKKKKKEKEKALSPETENTDPNGIEDPFAEQRKEDEKLANSMNLIEVSLTRHYQSKSKVKEIRNAFEQRGSKWNNNLYYTTTVKSNFNFFQNLLHLNDLHETPVSSPISGPGILSYKYRLESQYKENGQKINKIKIIPRNTATTTLEGYIYVIDSLWLVQKLELTMEKGNLKVYDYFTISQEFEHPGDSICILAKQVLSYGVKYKNQSSTCITYATFNDYNFKPEFDPKFFNNEVAVTEQEAYEKDSTFWKQARETELTDEESKYIAVKDSIYDSHHRTEYLDSIDSLFNKVTALKVLLFGVDHRNRSKKTQWTIGSLAGTIKPIFIGGPRIGPSFYFFKKWNDERSISLFTRTSVGILNGDPKGLITGSYRYSPFHFGDISILFYHHFDAIRSYDAISQIYKRDNFIETTNMVIEHDYEVLNGLFFEVELSITERRSLEKYKFFDGIDEYLPNNDPTKFEPYQAVIASFELDYTPGQKYMREPNRKVILGSRWPNFYISYEKGVPGIFGSDVDHDYLRAGVLQTFKIGTIGTSSYHLKTGSFLNNKIVKDADQKFQRRSDPIWFSNPLYSFQGLDSTLPTRNATFEAHFVHHDNGSIINKIPFMKKTRIGLVFGSGALYIPEFNWQHYEIFAGLERVFKFSRQRLRIGLYGVISDGNQISPTPTWKVAFSLMDNRDMQWNF